MGGSSSRPTGDTDLVRQVVITGVAASNYSDGSEVFTIYEFGVTFRGFSWRINHRFSEVYALHRAVRHLVPDLHVRPPKKTAWRDTGPDFVSKRQALLVAYLSEIANVPIVWSSPATRGFFEIGSISFCSVFGRKGKEGWLRKRSGGRGGDSGGLFFSYRKRWFVLKDCFIAYFSSPDDPLPLDVFFIDSGFTCEHLTPTDLVLVNNYRRLHLRMRHHREMVEWLHHLERHFVGAPRAGLCPCASFSPMRPGTVGATWFINGRGYFGAVARAMLSAVGEIFIAGWWIVPEIELVRGPLTGHGGGISSERYAVTLRDVLLTKAREGVKIYILLYKELAGVMKNQSQSAKNELVALHPNVQVIRHPDHYAVSGTLFWSHHEKIVVVDQKIAFVGGIDFALGRFDDVGHRLSDPEELVWRGRDYYNSEVIDRAKSGRSSRPLRAADGLLRTVTESLPSTPAVFSRLLSGGGGGGGSGDGDGSDSSIVVGSVVSVSGKASVLGRDLDSSTVVEGRPMSRSVVSSAPRVPDPLQHHRLPWHDLAVCFGPPASLDVAVHFITRWNHHRVEKGTAGHHPVLVPRSDTNEWWNLSRRQLAVSSSLDDVPCPAEHTNGGRSVEMLHVTERWDRERAGSVDGEQSSDEGGAQKRGDEDNVDGGSVTGSEAGKGGRTSPADDAAASGEWSCAACTMTNAPDAVVCTACLSRRGEALPAEVVESLDGGIRFAAAWLPPVKEGRNLCAADVYEIVTADTPCGLLEWDAHRPPLVPAAADAGAADSSEYSLPPGSVMRVTGRDYVPAAELALFDCRTHGPCTVHVVRSVGQWSAGMPTEVSIQNAYVELIRSSEHFVYIENQFFMSGVDGITNHIASALVDRIRRAIRSESAFRAVVVIPVHPEGFIYTNRTAQLVMHNQYRTIHEGDDSVVGTLRREFPDVDPFDYVSFYSLRTEGTVGMHDVTEQVYIHCKLMIVDDRTVIVGSANLNDRSQLGDRDSELCAVISRGDSVESRMGGRPWQASEFAHSFRVRLWEAHLGMLGPSRCEVAASGTELPQPPLWHVDVSDPIEAYKAVWMRTALENTIYFEAKYVLYEIDELTGVLLSLLGNEPPPRMQKAQLPVGLPLSATPPSERHGVLVWYSSSFNNKGAGLASDVLAAESLLPRTVFQ